MVLISQNMNSRKLTPCEITSASNALLDNGFAVIKGYVDATKCYSLSERLSSLHSELAQRSLASGSPIGLQSSIAADRIINNIIAFDNSLLAVTTSGDHLSVLAPVLNDKYYGLIPDDEPNFLLAQANAREGSSALPFHVDVRLMTHGKESWSYQAQLACSTRNANTGGLRVRPQSHMSGVMPDSSRDYKDAIDVPLNPGDLALFSSKLHHATYAAKSGFTPGWAINLTYRCWWVKPQFDFWRMLDDKQKRTLRPNQKLLLGACSIPSADVSSSPSMRTGYDDL